MKRIILLCVLFTALTTSIGCILEARNVTANAEPASTPVTNAVTAGYFRQHAGTDRTG